MSQKKKQIRASFRNAVFKRDQHRCRVCNYHGRLDAHHITDSNEMPNGGYVLENGIALCEVCHMMAEQYHISGGTDYPLSWHPTDLYRKIGSSKEQAIIAAQKLSNN